jgi:hypothetical protein
MAEDPRRALARGGSTGLSRGASYRRVGGRCSGKVASLTEDALGRLLVREECGLAREGAIG